MAYLTIEFSGRITANDDEIRDGVERAKDVFRKAGKSPDDAWRENMKLADESGHFTDLWTQADYAATKDMGEGATLSYR
jgi:hypothetical protein